MAHNPNNDMPVKEVAVRSLQRPPEPPVLERSVEDRYLEVRQENEQLKLRLQEREDKMKRLATKLMRLMSEQKQQLDAPEARRALELQATLADQQESMERLRAANATLQKRVAVMRRQLAEQGRLRASLLRYRHPSPSRGPPPAQCSPVESSANDSRPGREAGSPARVPGNGEGVDTERDRLQAHVMLLEQEKMSLSQRLEEAELREKRRQVGENVELIRLRRSLAQQAAQLAALEERGQAMERELVQARHSLSAAHRDAEGAQQQRSVLKNRVLELEAEVQSLQSDRWRCLELEVAVKDLQMERDAVQGQNARLLEMVEERGRDRGAQVARLEERLADEACQRARLTDRLRVAQQQLSEVQAQVSGVSHGDRGGAGTDCSLLDQVGRLEGDLAREMQERVRLIQLLEGLHMQRDSPTSRGAHQDGGAAPPAHGEPRPEESSPRPQSGGPPPATSTAAVPARCSVACMTDQRLSSGSGLHQSVQVALDEVEAGPPPRVPSLEQSKRAVMGATHRRPPVPQAPTLLESAGLPDESEATDADLSLGRDRSRGEVSSDSAPAEPSQGEVSGDSAGPREPWLAERSRAEESSCVVGDSPGVDGLSTANHLETVLELDKCRDLLRVQCRINSSLQDELTVLRQQQGQAVAAHARQLAELRRQLEGRAVVAGGGAPPGARGLLEVHAGTLQLEPGVLGDLERRRMFLSWVLWDNEVTCTPPQPAGKTVRYEYSAVYKVDLGAPFLDYLRNARCVVELHVLEHDGGSRLCAQGSLHLAELLAFPGRRLHASAPLLPPDADEHLGTLHCWFRLARLGSAPLDGTMTPAPAPRTAPTPAPRSSVQPPGLGATSGGGPHDVESAARMKRLADSVLGQFLEQKWQESRLAANTTHHSPATATDLTVADENNAPQV